MDSLALQIVPDPRGTYSLSNYTNIMGTPGMTAFVGLEGVIGGQKASAIKHHYLNIKYLLCILQGETLFVSSGASGVGRYVQDSLICCALLRESQSCNSARQTQRVGLDYISSSESEPLFTRMRIIASAGSDSKVEFLRTLRVDIPFNYKKESYEAVLAKHGPIDAFWVRTLLGTCCQCIIF